MSDQTELKPGSTIFFAPSHDFTKRLLDQLLPGRRVKDFSLHFSMEKVATLKAEMVLHTDDMEKLVGLCEEYDLQILETPQEEKTPE